MTALATLLTGDGAYANVREILKGIELRQLGVRPDVAPHSIYEELWHLVYWQDFLLDWIQGKGRSLPENEADSWPIRQEPADLTEARDLVRRFLEGINTAREIAAEPDRLATVVREKYTVQSLLETLLAHNSYHLGKIVLLRQLIGIWPHPSKV